MDAILSQVWGPEFMILPERRDMKHLPSPVDSRRQLERRIQRCWDGQEGFLEREEGRIHKEMMAQTSKVVQGVWLGAGC